MKTLKVKFSTIDHVKKFVNAIQSVDVDIDLVHNRYVIDAKSIMGIFSMDLSRPLDLVIHSEDKEITDSLSEIFSELGILV